MPQPPCVAPWLDRRFLSFTLQFAVEGRKGESGTDDLRARFRFVSPGYFATLGIPLIEGRDFTEADRKESEMVVVVSKSVAQQLFPGQDAINRHIMWTDPLIKVAGISPNARRIVGVLADVDDANILPQHNLTIYQPFAQGPVFGACLLVRASKDPIALVPSITKTIRAVAATQPVEHASTLEDVRTEVLANNRVNAIVFGGFAISRVSDFSGRNCGRAGIFGELAHARVRNPARSRRPAALDSLERAARRSNHGCDWRCRGRSPGLGIVTLGRQLHSGTSASGPDSVDRIGSGRGYGSGLGIVSTGCACGASRHDSSASRRLRSCRTARRIPLSSRRNSSCCVDWSCSAVRGWQMIDRPPTHGQARRISRSPRALRTTSVEMHRNRCFSTTRGAWTPASSP